MRFALRTLTLIVLAALAAQVVSGPASAATKTTKKPPQRVVLGTTQLSGDQAAFGKTYTLGKRGPINVTLNSAEYTVEPVRFGNGVFATDAGQKILVLHYTLHNPNKTDYRLAWSTLNITAVDSKDQNWRYQTVVGMEKTGESCSMSLKPAQKTNVYAAIIVPAAGEIPKVIFEASDKLVLRYDLRSKVKPLPAPVADPADSTGATAREKVPGEIGTFYRLKELQGRVDSIKFSDESIGGKPPRKGQRYVVITCTAKNTLPWARHFAWSTFKPKLMDSGDAELKGSISVYFGHKDETVSTDIEPGQEIKLRFVYQVPQGLGLKSFSMYEGNGRQFVFDASNVN